MRILITSRLTYELTDFRIKIGYKADSVGWLQTALYKADDLETICCKKIDFSKNNRSEMKGFHAVCFILCLLVILGSLMRVEASSCEAVDEFHTIRRKGCTSKRVLIKECSGQCFSREVPISRWPFFVQECSCCVPIAQKYVYFQLSCGSNTKTVKLPSAIQCKCQNSCGA